MQTLKLEEKYKISKSLFKSKRSKRRTRTSIVNNKSNQKIKT